LGFSTFKRAATEKLTHLVTEIINEEASHGESAFEIAHNVTATDVSGIYQPKSAFILHGLTDKF